MVVRALFAAAAAVTVASGVAFAATSDDVEACKVFAGEKGMIEAANYRFKFEGAKGGRVKKISLAVIPTVDGDPAFDGVCEMKSGKVVDLELKEI